MTVAMPSIKTTFKQLSATLVARSTRGIVILIITDSTATNVWKSYGNITDALADSALYTNTNMQYIKDAFLYGTDVVNVARITGTGTLATVLTYISNTIQTGCWIGYPDGATTDQQTLATWIKTQESNGKTYKAVVYKAATTDSKHIVNFYNDNVVYTDSRGLQLGNIYIPSLLSMFATCNVVRGCTYFNCTDLTSVTEVADRNIALGKGQFILINDNNDVRVATDVNSLQTITAPDVEDMKYVAIVEAMDMITDDINNTLKNSYIGIKNTLDNQMLGVGAVRGYFQDLADEGVLDENYANTCDINITAQRNAWITNGTTDAVNWTDAKIKNMTFKRNMYLTNSIKIVNSISNIDFNVNMA